MYNSIANKIISRKAARLERFAEVPFEIQQNQLMRLVHEARNTFIGKQYGFSEISSIDEYRRRVPLHSYDDLKPYFERARYGEKDIVWPGTISKFAKSSGTTNDKSKFIPVTDEGLDECHLQGGRDTMSIYSKLFPKHTLYSGRCITLGGSQQIDKDNHGVHLGDLSAIMIQNMPKWIHLFRAPKRETALIADWNIKLEKLTAEVLKQNITSFAGVPSWNLVMMKHILEVSGKNNLLEIWPNLELYLHGGVNFLPYVDQFKKIIPSPRMNYMETYNASEGFFAIQDDLKVNSMLLMLDYGVFFEFIPMDHIYEENPKTYHIGEVEKGKNYAIVVSSSNGLWRYMIGDTVCFDSLYPHKIHVTGRTKHFINAFGEEVIIDNAERALHEACIATDALIHEYTAAPVYMADKAKGAHEWVIEFEKEPACMQEFSRSLDNALKNINSDYEAKRHNNITIDKPIIRPVVRNTFFKWFEEKNKLGGQNKMPRLSNDRKYVEEILNVKI